MRFQLRHQRNAAQLPVAIGKGIHETASRRSLHQLWQIGRIALDLRQPGNTNLLSSKNSQRLGKDSRLSAVGVGRKIKPLHHRLPAQTFRQQGIGFQQCFDCLQAPPHIQIRHRKIVLQPFVNVFVVVFIRFRKQDVKTQQRHLLALQQLSAKPGNNAAAPGPMAKLPQTGFVNIDNHNAIVAHTAGIEHAQTMVVYALLNPGDEFVLRQAKHGRQHDHQRNEHHGRTQYGSPPPAPNSYLAQQGG